MIDVLWEERLVPCSPATQLFPETGVPSVLPASAGRMLKGWDLMKLSILPRGCSPVSLAFSFFLFNIYLFIYWAALGLSCHMWIFVAACELLVVACGI